MENKDSRASQVWGGKKRRESEEQEREGREKSRCWSPCEGGLAWAPEGEGVDAIPGLD